MNTKVFCKNDVYNITCNSQQHIYIESMIILPIRTECSGEQQCLLENVKTFFASINDTCNGKHSCNLDRFFKTLFDRPCNIQKTILENINICGK